MEPQGNLKYMALYFTMRTLFLATLKLQVYISLLFFCNFFKSQNSQDCKFKFFAILTELFTKLQKQKQKNVITDCEI